MEPNNTTLSLVDDTVYSPFILLSYPVLPTLDEHEPEDCRWSNLPTQKRTHVTKQKLPRGGLSKLRQGPQYLNSNTSRRKRQNNEQHVQIRLKTCRLESWNEIGE